MKRGAEAAESMAIAIYGALDPTDLERLRVAWRLRDEREDLRRARRKARKAARKGV